MSAEENNVRILPQKSYKFFVKDLVRACPWYYFKTYCNPVIYDPTTSVEVLALKGDTE